MLYFLLAILLSVALWTIYNSSQTLRDAPFVPSEPQVIIKMLNMAEVGEKDLLFDLGSGDGRMVIAAACRGASAVGVEADRIKVWYSRIWISLLGLSRRAKIIRSDIFKEDISKATVVTLFLLNETNRKLKPKLIQELKSGTKVVSYAFPIAGWKAVREEIMPRSLFGKIYLYRVPKNSSKSSQ